MKKITVLFLALVLSISAVSGTSASAPTLSSTTVAFGDSNTDGTNWKSEGYDYDKKWVSILQAQRPVLNFGISGNTTGQGLNRIQSVIDTKPRTAIVMFGTNDGVLNSSFIPKTSWRQFEINLNKIVDKFQANGTNVILMTALPIIEEEYYKRHDKNLYLKYGGARAFHNEYNNITRKVAKEQGVALMDTYHHFLRFSKEETDEALLNSGLIDSSGTHLSMYGAKILHSNLEITLKNYGY